VQVRRGDIASGSEEVQEGRMAMARDLLGFGRDGDAVSPVGSSADSLFSTVRRLAKVVVSLGQVLSSFTRV
jgi:hypothetical protein